QFSHYGSGKLCPCDLRVSISAYTSSCGRKSVCSYRFCGRGVGLVRHLVECTSREYILRVLDFLVHSWRFRGLRRWSRLRPAPSTTTLTYIMLSSIGILWSNCRSNLS